MHPCPTNPLGGLRLRVGLLVACVPLVGCVSVSGPEGPAGTSPTGPRASLVGGPSQLMAGEPSPIPTPTLAPSPDPWPSPSARPTAPPTVPPFPSVAPSPSALPVSEVPDPIDLPRFPGSERIGSQVTREDGLHITSLRYQAAASVDRLRAHYRAALREHGWRLGEIEFDDAAWEIDASKGAREAEIEIDRQRERMIVSITISQP